MTITSLCKQKELSKTNLREPPYRRRETLIERLGFLFVQISRLSSLFPRQAIGFKQAGQAAGKD